MSSPTMMMMLGFLASAAGEAVARSKAAIVERTQVRDMSFNGKNIGFESDRLVEYTVLSTQYFGTTQISLSPLVPPHPSAGTLVRRRNRSALRGRVPSGPAAWRAGPSCAFFLPWHGCRI